MRNIAIFVTKKYIFSLQTTKKISTTLINHTKNIKNEYSVKGNSVKGLTSSVRESISPVREQHKSPAMKYYP